VYPHFGKVCAATTSRSDRRLRDKQFCYLREGSH
jgi:hypothetical protein